MTPKHVKDIFDKLPSKRRKVLVGFLAGHSREKIMIDAGVPSNDALTGHLKELYKNFRIDTGWNDADDRRSGTRKLPSLISLFARCMPELISDRIPDVLDGVEQEEAIAKRYQESVESDAGLIEDRIFKATDQLNPERPVFSRISGIQALGEIAKDSPRYHWQIMEVLAAFVRTNAPRKEEGEEERSSKLLDDIQAALTVIGRRNLEKDPSNMRLDLSNTDIRGVTLTEANLQGAILSNANLQGAYLKDAKLPEADLKEANLQRAKLWRAELQKATLWRANLERAVLNGAELQGAILDYACLEMAYLWCVNLQKAKLRNTKLKGAILREADLQGATLDGADLKGAFLNGANLEGVFLDGADLKGANLSEAKNLKSSQLETAFGDSQTLLPDDVEAPARWQQSGELQLRSSLT